MPLQPAKTWYQRGATSAKRCAITATQCADDDRDSLPTRSAIQRLPQILGHFSGMVSGRYSNRTKLLQQASIFATVNLAQTKVNKSLVYDLTELAKTRSPRQTCHNVAVAIDGQPKSPLYQRIKRLGTKTPGREKEPLTQAAFVESLVRFISVDPVTDRNDLLDGKRLKLASSAELEKVPFRNLFISKKDVEIAEILHNYFSAVKMKWSQSWDDLSVSGNLLPKSNAFKALMKYLREDVYPELSEGKPGRVPSKKEFLTYFEDLDLKDSDFTTANFVPGSGGQSMFLKMLRREVSRSDLIE